MTEGPLLWFLNRGTGLVLLAMLTLVTALGVWSVHTRAGSRMPGFVVQAVHRNLSLLAVALLLVHVGTAVADEYVDIRWWQAVVPWRLAYRPLWLGLGTLALDLVALIAITSILRRRLGHRTWRLVHWTAYAAWGLGLAHGLGIGTDTGEPWAFPVYVGSAAVVLGAGAARLRSPAGSALGSLEVGR